MILGGFISPFQAREKWMSRIIAIFFGSAESPWSFPNRTYRFFTVQFTEVSWVIGVPPNHHLFVDGISLNKPTSYWGTPMTMETTIYQDYMNYIPDSWWFRRWNPPDMVNLWSQIHKTMDDLPERGGAEITQVQVKPQRNEYVRSIWCKKKTQS